MDGALPSSRYNPGGGSSSSGNNNTSMNNNNNNNNRGGYHRGGRGRGGRGYRRGGGYNNHHRNYHNRRQYNNHGHRRHNHHHHNNHHHNNHHGGNRMGNRFGSNNRGSSSGGPSSSASSSVDPQNAMWIQLSAMVAQMSNSSSNSSKEDVVKNMMDLIQVLTTENNAPLFLNIQLCQLIVHCASTLPLHTPNYAALTFGLHQYAPPSSSIAQQCVEYTCQRLCWDLPHCDTSADAYMRVKLLLRYLTYLCHIGILPWTSNTSTNSADGKTLSEFLQWMLDQKQMRLTSLVYSTIPYLLQNNNNNVNVSSREWIQSHVPLQALDASQYQSLYEPGLGIHSLLLQDEQYEPNNNDTDHDDDDDDDDDDEEEDSEDEEEDAVPCADTWMDLHRTVTQLITDPTNSTTTNFSFLTHAPWNQLWAKKQPPTVKMEDDDITTTTAEAEEELTPLKYTQEPLLLFTGSTPLPNLSSTTSTNNNNNNSGSLDAIVFGRLSLFGTQQDDEDEDDDEEEDDLEEKEESSSSPQWKAYTDNFTLMDRYFLGESIRDVLHCHRCSVSDTGVDKGTTKDVAEQIWSTSQLFSHPTSNNNNNNTKTNNIKTEDTMDTTTEDTTTDTTNATTATSGGTNGLEYGIVETMLSLLLQQSGSFSHVYLSRVLLELVKLQPKTIPQALVVAVSSLIMDYLPNLVPSARHHLSSWFAFHLTNTDYQWPSAYWKLYNSNNNNNNNNNNIHNNNNNNTTCRAQFLQRTLHTMSQLVSSPTLLLTNNHSDTTTTHDNNTTNNDQLSSPSVVESPMASLVYDLYHVHHTDSNNNNSNSNSSNNNELQLQLQQRIWKQMEDPDTIREYMVGDDISNTTTMEDATNEEDDPIIWWRTNLILQSLLLPAQKDIQHQQSSLLLYQKSISPSSTTDDDNTTTNNNNTSMDDTTAITTTTTASASNENEEEDGDVLGEIHTALQRYRPVVLATLAKDTQAHEENLQLNGQTFPSQEDLPLLGEISILQQVYQTTCYSPLVVFTNCLEYLLQTQIVSVMSVFHWLLQQPPNKTKNNNNNNNNNNNMASIHASWWNYASLALRVGLVQNVIQVTNDESEDNAMTAADNHDMGMVIDTVGIKEEDDNDNNNDNNNDVHTHSMEEEDEDDVSSPSLEKTKKVIAYITPFIQYTARTICTTLVDVGENYSTIYGKHRKYKKRMTPLEVNLVEGFKHLMRFTWNEIHTTYWDMEKDSKIVVATTTTNTTGEQPFDDANNNNKNDNPPPPQNRQPLNKLLSKSSLSGKQLASYCRSSCPKYENTFAEMIVQTLDRL